MNAINTYDLNNDVYYGDPYHLEENTYQWEQKGWNDAKNGKKAKSDNCFYRRGYEAFKASLLFAKQRRSPF